MQVEKKHVLVLGGSSDIGIEVVKFFLSINWKVTAHYNRIKKELINIKKQTKDLNIVQFNLAKIDFNIERKLKEKFGKGYDSIINLIGYVDSKTYENTSYKNIIQTLSANTIFPFLIERMSIKKMLSKKWGRIVNCSSIGVKFGGGFNTYNYSLSKHSLEFIPSVYKKWAKKNVLINNLRIGVTNTKLHKKLKRNINKRIKLIPIGRMATPIEISHFIVELATEKNSFITGQTVDISGGE